MPDRRGSQGRGIDAGGQAVRRSGCRHRRATASGKNAETRKDPAAGCARVLAFTGSWRRRCRRLSPSTWPSPPRSSVIATSVSATPAAWPPSQRARCCRPPASPCTPPAAWRPWLPSTRSSSPGTPRTRGRPRRCGRRCACCSSSSVAKLGAAPVLLRPRRSRRRACAWGLESGWFRVTNAVIEVRGLVKRYGAGVVHLTGEGAQPARSLQHRSADRAPAQVTAGHRRPQ